MASKWSKQIQEHDEKVVKQWNANNTKKLTTDNLSTVPSKKEQEKERKRLLAEQKRKKEEAERKKKEEEARKKRERLEAQKKRRENLKKETKKKTKRRVMTEKAKKSQHKAMNTYAYPRAILGAMEGAVNATTGLSTENDGIATEETKQSGAYKAGKVAGQVLSYATGYGSIGGATTKIAGKALSTKAGKALTTKLAKNKIVKEAAKKTLKKQGQNVTEKAVEHMARKTANKVAEGLVRNAVGDATLGTVMDSNIARSKGYKIGSDEWNKEMAINAALNVGVGGAVEVAPTVAKALSNTKVAQNVSEGLVKASDKANAIGDKVNAIGDTVTAKLPQKKAKLPAVKETVKAELPEPVVKAETQDSLPNNEVVTNVPAKASAETVADTPAVVPQKTARQQAYDDIVNQKNELMAKEVSAHAETIKNYKKQVVVNNFTPDRERLEAGWEATDGFGYSTRSSMNEQWYQDFYRKNGRPPNQSEMEALAREHIENDLFTARNNPESVGDAELGASPELRELDRKQAQMEWEDEAINTYRTEPVDAEWSEPSMALLADSKFEKALGQHYTSIEDMETAAKDAGLSVNDWLKMKGDEFYQFGKVDALDPPKETVGGFEVEGDTSMGIVSKDFREMSEWFDSHAKPWWEKFRKQVITGQQEIERFEKVGGIESTKGRTQAVRNANGTLAYIFNEKLVDSAGKVLDDRSYKQLIKMIPENKLDDFNKYAQHLHNIDRIAVNPKKAVYRQTTALESAKIVDDLLRENPEFAKYSNDIKEWWEKFTKAWLLDTGRMTQEAYDAMLKKYPNYIPTYRVDKRNSIAASVANRVNAGKAVGGAVGGTSEVIPLQDGFLQEMGRIVTSTRKNDLYASIIDELRKNPEKLKQFGVVMDDAPAVTGDDLTHFLDNIEKEGLKSVEDRVAQVTAYIDGKPVSAYINKNMFDALKLLDNTLDKNLYGLFVNTGRAITNPAKALITGLNPLFALSNAMRDLPTLLIQSDNGMWQTVKNVGMASTEIFRADKVVRKLPVVGKRYAKRMEGRTPGEFRELYKALGGKHAGYFAQGKGYADIKTHTSSLPKKALRTLETAVSALGETAETIPRLAEFIGSLEKYGGDKDAALKALYDAGEVTVNFSRSAPTTKLLDAWTLYLNAAVQGLDKFGRTMRAHPVRTTARSLSVISAPYLLLLAENYNNPHYHDLNERTKQNYFCVPNYFGEKDVDDNPMTFIKVPVNREYGALFGSTWDVLAGYMNGERGLAELTEGLDETYKTNFLPPSPLGDNVLMPATFQLKYNKDFADRSIVPTNLLKASPKNQYDANTSGAAMGIATGANNLAERLPITDPIIPEAMKSPKKVDFLMDSYLGIAGTALQSATSNKKDNLLASKFTADPRYSSGILEDFYNDMAEVETGKVDEGLEGTNGVNYAKMKVYTDISEQLTELSKQEKEILSNSSLTKAQKEKQISALRQQKNEIARSAKAKAKQAEAEYKSAPDYAVMAKDVKAKYVSGQGVSKQQFADAYNAQTIKDGAKKELANIMEMYSAGASYDAAKMASSKVSESSWATAANLADSGISPSELQRIATEMNVDGGGYKKDEILNYLNNSNYSQTQKAYLFSAFATWRNAQNPY